MKSNLEVRPMFHWTPRRIKGHFVVCFLAFLVQRELEFRMRKKGIHTSTQEIQRAINSGYYCEGEGVLVFVFGVLF